MKKLFRGSALVYALIMMMLLLVSALSLATTTVLQKRSATSTVESMRAFESANDGFEDVLSRYKRNPNGTVGSLGTSCDSSTGAVTQTVGTSSYTATFKDASGTDITSCATKLSDVAQVKVVATVGSSTKVIETALAVNKLTCFDLLDTRSNGASGGVPGQEVFQNINTSVKTDLDDTANIKYGDLKNKTGQEACKAKDPQSVCVSRTDNAQNDDSTVAQYNSNSCEVKIKSTGNLTDTQYQESIFADDVVRCCKF